MLRCRACRILQDMTTTADEPQTVRRRQARLLTVVLAAMAAELAWLLADPIGGLDLMVQAGEQLQQITAGTVLLGAVIPGLMAWGLVAVIERRSARPRAVLTTCAGIALVLSLGGPLTEGDGITTKLVLTGFHLIVGAVLILGFRRTLR